MSLDRPQQQTNASAIEECLDEISFARAAELARTGMYLEAQALLSSQGRVPDSPRELDLLARIAAHQERFEDATRFWNAALKRDPDNATYRECLQQLSQIQAGGQPSGATRTHIMWYGIAVLAIVVLIGLFLFTHRTPTAEPGKSTATTSATGAVTAHPSESQNLPAPPVTPLAQTATKETLVTATTESVTALHRVEQTLQQMQETQREQIQSLTSHLTAIQATNSLLLADVHTTQTRLADLTKSVTELNDHQVANHRAMESTRSELAALAAAHASATLTATKAQGLLPDLARFNPGISGVTVTPNKSGCIIRFDSGLFDRDQHFKIGAKARIQSLAKALVQTQAKIKVQVIGIAEDEPPTWPWSRAQTSEELGLQRAQCATAYLLGLGIIPPDKLSAVSGTTAQRPYPTPDRNNRTVLLEVSSD